MPDAYLLDTNVLLRRARPNDPLQPAARNAINTLAAQGAQLFITAQNVIEYWNVLTRPVANNGFGMTPTEAETEARQLENFFPLLIDTPDVYKHRRHLVVNANVSGVKVHDARLVAVMLTHQVTHLLTFNLDDFKRFSQIVAVSPLDV